MEKDIMNYHGWPKSAFVMDKSKRYKGLGQVTGGDQCYVFVTFAHSQEMAIMPGDLAPVNGDYVEVSSPRKGGIK